jgi:hypothetical protein
MIDAPDDRPAETVVAGILYRPQGGHAGGRFAQHGPGGVGAAVVHGHDFVFDIVQPQLDVQMFNGRGRPPPWNQPFINCWFGSALDRFPDPFFVSERSKSVTALRWFSRNTIT